MRRQAAIREMIAKVLNFEKTRNRVKRAERGGAKMVARDVAGESNVDIFTIIEYKMFK